jgi:pilus assembly protein CpaB
VAKLPAPGSGGGLRRAAERGRRRSGLRAGIFLAVAVLAAIGTALVLTRYLDARTAAARIPTVKVVVAAMDIPLATALRAEALRAVDWPAASRPDAAVSDPAALVGRVATANLAKGEAILEVKLASSEAGSGLAALLPSGMRAMSVRVDDIVGVAGFVHPGDHVDVIATMRAAEGSNQPPVSKIVLQGIRVLAVGKDVSHAGKNEKAVAATVATLMVTSDQSEKLALAATKGQILLSLRSRIDVVEVETTGITPPVLLGGGKVPAPAPVPASASAGATRRPPSRAAAQPRPATPPQERQTVEVIRGDLFEKRDFQRESRESRQ